MTKTTLWTGRILSALAVIFLAFDSAIKLTKLQVVADASARLGYPLGSMAGIGLLLMACTLIYVIPRTSALGAVLLTGYLGGAVATHVRVGNPAFEITFPVIVGSVIWAGLFMRDHRVRTLLAPR